MKKLLKTDNISQMNISFKSIGLGQWKLRVLALVVLVYGTAFNLSPQSVSISNVVSRCNSQLAPLATLTASMTISATVNGRQSVQRGTIYYKSKKYRTDFTSPTAMSMIVLGSNSYMKGPGETKYTKVNVPAQTMPWASEFLSGFFLKETGNNGTTVDFSAFRDAAFKDLVCFGTFNIASALLLEITMLPSKEPGSVQSKSTYEYKVIGGIPIPSVVRSSASAAGQSVQSVLELTSVLVNNTISDAMFTVE